MKSSIILDLARKHNLMLEASDEDKLCSIVNEALSIVENRSVWVLISNNDVLKYYNDFPKLETLLLDEALGDFNGKILREIHKNKKAIINNGFGMRTLKFVKLENCGSEESYPNYAAAESKLTYKFGAVNVHLIATALKHVSFPMSKDEMDKAVKFIESKRGK